MTNRFTPATEGYTNTTCVVFHIIDETDPTDWDGTPHSVFATEDEAERDAALERLNAAEIPTTLNRSDTAHRIQEAIG